MLRDNGFDQAEEGIRASDAGLEFGGVLFRSDALMAQFGNVQAIREADVEQPTRLRCSGPKLAVAVDRRSVDISGRRISMKEIASNL
ncbi:hypothetical protein BLX87_17820 [Bacillus sp. VT-16-64]|nr:hypothetical protein BLX87_17820 [Bacillus sp. VT-16-64]